MTLAGGLTGCHDLAVVRPAAAPLRPGTYVLTRLGEAPAPFVYLHVNESDTLALAFTFAFDTVRIVNDSDFTRHFRRELLELRPGQPPVLADSDEFDYAGIILNRGDEVKLTTRSGSPGGVLIAYFVPRDSALARHTQVTRFFCQSIGCDLLSDRRVDAWYERR